MENRQQHSCTCKLAKAKVKVATMLSSGAVRLLEAYKSANQNKPEPCWNAFHYANQMIRSFSTQTKCMKPRKNSAVAPADDYINIGFAFDRLPFIIIINFSPSLPSHIFTYANSLFRSSSKNGFENASTAILSIDNISNCWTETSSWCFNEERIFCFIHQFEEECSFFAFWGGNTYSERFYLVFVIYSSDIFKFFSLFYSGSTVTCITVPYQNTSNIGAVNWQLKSDTFTLYAELVRFECMWFRKIIGIKKRPADNPSRSWENMFEMTSFTEFIV